jgi:hypothetical protein
MADDPPVRRSQCIQDINEFSKGNIIKDLVENSCRKEISDSYSAGFDYGLERGQKRKCKGKIRLFTRRRLNPRRSLKSQLRHIGRRAKKLKNRAASRWRNMRDKAKQPGSNSPSASNHTSLNDQIGGKTTRRCRRKPIRKTRRSGR